MAKRWDQSEGDFVKNAAFDKPTITKGKSENRHKRVMKENCTHPNAAAPNNACTLLYTLLSRECAPIPRSPATRVGGRWDQSEGDQVTTRGFPPTSLGTGSGAESRGYK